MCCFEGSARHVQCGKPCWSENIVFAHFFRNDAGIKKRLGAEWQNRRLDAGECTVFKIMLETNLVDEYFYNFRDANLDISEF